MASFFAEHWLVISFYALIILALFVFRKKFEFQGKIVALLRTNWGVEWMQKYGEKHARAIQIIGYIGIGVGFLGMLTIVGFLVYGVWQLFVNPAAPPVISPVLPGVQVPGSPFTFPLFETIIALFVVIVVHEAAHGLVAAAHGVKVEASGLLMLGPIFGAFVEPDEEELPKRPHKVQHSVFAAGPWSNILLALVFFGLALGGTLLMFGQPVDGVQFDNVVADSPAALAGVQPDVTYTHVNGEPIQSVATVFMELQNASENDTLILTGPEGNTSVVLGAAHPETGYPTLGVAGFDHEFTIEQEQPLLGGLMLFIFGDPYRVGIADAGVLAMIYILALGLGLANLLPLGPVDGGRMWQLVLRKWLGEEKGDRVWAKSSFLVLFIVLALLFIPIIRAVVVALGAAPIA